MNAKKLISLVLALVLVLAISATAMAEDETTYTITAPSNGHTYEVYQIFTGDLEGNVLTNVKWGKNGTGTEGESVEDDILTEIEAATGTDSAKLAVITKYATLTASAAYGTVEDGTPLENVPAGYYLIKDVDNALDNTVDAYTHYIVQVANNITISPKAETTTSGKTIKDEGKAADYSIGDDVPFVLTATVPSADTLADYQTYSLKFNDSMSDGLTYNADSATVYIDGTEITSGFDIKIDGQSLTVTIADIKTLGADGGDKVTVEYTAKLNSNAVIGSTGNANTLDLDYSNNPQDSAEGHTPKGDTTDDTVIVFTYELDTTKVDGANNATKLPDAEFVLYRVTNSGNEYVKVDANGKVTGWTTTKTEASTLKSDASGLFKVTGLDAGSYKLEETKAPSGYNLLTDPVDITITATITETETAQTLDKLMIDVTANGKTSFGEGVTSTGVVNATVENNKGATLPTTGGMGTTMIYIAGGLLVAAAAILLISKRRAGAAE